MAQEYTWDFFISHASADLPLAQDLFKVLHPPAVVFLDAESLGAGEWAKSLSDALDRSLISIILISPNTENAYYVQEEVTIAINRTRADPHTHKVIPVLVNKKAVKKVPFGLNSQQSLFVDDGTGFANIKGKLENWLAEMKRLEIKKVQVVAQQKGSIEKITDPQNSADVFKGLLGVTNMVRPLMLTLISLLVVTFLMLIVFMLIPSADRSLRLITTGSIFLLLLFSTLTIFSRFLQRAPLIATGNIDAG